uniref:Glomulin n=1 Tax=Panagrolaimus sp. PS1159 TaxID=55785 RepID=A0AC35FVP9_9BILA
METEMYSAIVDLIEKQDYAALVKLCQTEKSAEFLKIHSFDLLETLIYAFMDNKDKLLIRCMKVLNVFVTPKERLLTYLTTIDNINSLTLCIHFARNTYKDIPDLPEKCLNDVRTLLLPKLFKNLVQFANESGGEFNPDCTVLTIFLRAILKLYVRSECDDEEIRIGFLSQVLMKRPFKTRVIRIQLNKILKEITYQPTCHEGLWLPGSVHELPFFILNECADDQRTGLLPKVYHPTHLLKIISKSSANYIEANWDDAVYLKNIFMAISYVARMIDPLSIPRQLLSDYKCLFTSLLKTNGTFRHLDENFTTIEVFTLLLENMEPVAQYLLIRELCNLIYSEELSITFVPHTIASLIDFYRNSLRHGIDEYKVFRDEIGCFYGQISGMSFPNLDLAYMFYSSVCILIQVHALYKFNETAAKTAKQQVLESLKNQVNEYEILKQLESKIEGIPKHFTSDVPNRVDLIKFEISEAEQRLNHWLEINNSTSS